MTVTQWRVLNGSTRVLLVRCILWQNGLVFPTSLSPIVLTGRKLGIEDLKQETLNDIQSKLTISNVAQELFTSFAAR